MDTVEKSDCKMADGAIAQQIMTESLLAPPVLLWKSLATELRTIGILTVGSSL